MQYLIFFIIISYFWLKYHNKKVSKDVYGTLYERPAGSKKLDTGKQCLKGNMRKLAFMEDCTIRRINGESLTIVYNERLYGKIKSISNKYLGLKAEMGIYIQNHVEECILDRVYTDSRSEYFLDIASCEDPVVFEWNEYTNKLLYKQLEIYMPIIRYFMLYGFNDLFRKDKEGA